MIIFSTYVTPLYFTKIMKKCTACTLTYVSLYVYYQEPKSISMVSMQAWHSTDCKKLTKNPNYHMKNDLKTRMLRVYGLIYCVRLKDDIIHFSNTQKSPFKVHLGNLRSSLMVKHHFYTRIFSTKCKVAIIFHLEYQKSYPRRAGYIF